MKPVLGQTLALFGAVTVSPNNNGNNISDKVYTSIMEPCIIINIFMSLPTICLVGGEVTNVCFVNIIHADIMGFKLFKSSLTLLEAEIWD